MTQLDSLGLLDLLEQHLGWYPRMELRDVYKLIYQAVLGSEHLISSSEEFSRYLQLEYERLQPDSSQQLFEPLRPDGSLFRLNLRPYKSRQLGFAQLISPLLQTSQFATGTRAELQATWNTFVDLCRQYYVENYSETATRKFTRQLTTQDFPAMHHSEVYRRLYQPAYRLISTHLIPGLGLADAV
jgi:hypothetical protein